MDTSPPQYIAGNAFAIIGSLFIAPEDDTAPVAEEIDQCISHMDWASILKGIGKETADAHAGGSSFTPGTDVLLADGRAIPISSLKPGDKVLATSAATGKTTFEAVTTVEVNHDTDLYDLKVKPPAASSHPHHRQPPVLTRLINTSGGLRTNYRKVSISALPMAR